MAAGFRKIIVSEGIADKHGQAVRFLSVEPAALQNAQAPIARACSMQYFLKDFFWKIRAVAWPEKNLFRSQSGFE